jgi:PAS domain S-box-containing protein
VRKAKQRFRRMVEMSSDWYWMQDEQFRFVEVPGTEEQESDVVVGKARWEIPGLGALPEKVWEQHRAKLARHESFSDFVFLRYNQAGELRYLSVSGEPLFDQKGKFIGYHGVGKDITDRARAQKALEDSERRYRMLFDVHPQPMWVVDANTLEFLAVNGAAMRLYGYSQEEFLAMTADQIRPEEDIDDLRRAFADWSNNYSQRIWRHKKKSGEIIPVKVTSFNLEFAGRRARMGVIEDLTERLMAEERAKQSEQRVRELLEQQGRGAG